MEMYKAEVTMVDLGLFILLFHPDTDSYRLSRKELRRLNRIRICRICGHSMSFALLIGSVG